MANKIGVAYQGHGGVWLAHRARDLDRLAWAATCALAAGGLLVVAAARLQVWKAPPGATVTDGRPLGGTVLRAAPAPAEMARWVVVRGSGNGSVRRGEVLEARR